MLPVACIHLFPKHFCSKILTHMALCILCGNKIFLFIFQVQVPSLPIKVSSQTPSHANPRQPAQSLTSNGNSDVMRELLNDDGSLRSRTPTPTREFLQSIGIVPSTITSASVNSSSVSMEFHSGIDEQELNEVLGLESAGDGPSDRRKSSDGVKVCTTNI